MLIEDLWNGQMDARLKEKADSFREHLIGGKKEDKIDEEKVKRASIIND